DGVYVFFFQAEDGIRDFHVTGVQTCALPISGDDGAPTVARFPTEPRNVPHRTAASPLPTSLPRFLSCGASPARSCKTIERGSDRSEERRVGKECSSRWAERH